MQRSAAGFQQFGPDHLAALAVVAVVGVGLSLLLRRAGGGRRAAELVLWALATLLLGGHLAEQASAVAGGYWSAQQTLPLHLCDIAALVVAAALITAGSGARRAGRPAGRTPARAGWPQFLYELAYYWGVGGTIQALLTPDLQDPFPSPAYFTYFAQHGGIVISVLVLTMGLGMRPRASALRRVWLLTNLLALPVALIDGLLGANYMFLCGPPENPSLYDWFGPWPWSLITLEIVGTLILVLCHVPFWLGRQVHTGA